MTTLKVDNLIFDASGTDVSSPLSGVINAAQFAVITGIVNPTNGNITTTGIISGGAFKTSGNVTVINSAGGVSPYGLYTLPSGVGISGYIAIKDGSTIAEWSTSVTTARSIALGKC
jgi:hypothetical protein